MTNNIQYYFGKPNDSGHIIASFVQMPPSLNQKHEQLEQEAMLLLGMMRRDALSDPATWGGTEPPSYRYFSALALLASFHDSSRRAADFMREWIVKDGVAEGQEPPPGHYGRFAVLWRGIEIEVTYTPARFAGLDHLEIRSIKPERTPLPFTETGYRSHQISRPALVCCGGVKVFVLSWLEACDTQDYRLLVMNRPQLEMF